MQALHIEQQEAGSRLDRVLCERLGLSRAQAKRLFEAGDVRRNGRRAGKGDLVGLGDLVELGSELRDPRAIADVDLPLVVLYEDAWFVVVAKAPGVPCHPLRPGETGCIANALVARYPEMAQVGYDSRQPGLVNRLDNDTSGVLLAARRPDAFDAARGLLERGEIHKRYIALTDKYVPTQRISLPLGPSPRHRSRVEVSPLGKPAVSDILGSEQRGAHFWVSVEAPRAYRHQVRVHLAALGAPIVGDALYGGSEAARHYLHALALRFSHPFAHRTVDVGAPLPGDFPGLVP